MASRECMLALELEEIERENIDGPLAKGQIRQYFPLCYTVFQVFRLVNLFR